MTDRQTNPPTSQATGRATPPFSLPHATIPSRCSLRLLLFFAFSFFRFYPRFNQRPFLLAVTKIHRFYQEVGAVVVFIKIRVSNSLSFSLSLSLSHTDRFRFMFFSFHSILFIFHSPLRSRLFSRASLRCIHDRKRRSLSLPMYVAVRAQPIESLSAESTSMRSAAVRESIPIKLDLQNPLLEARNGSFGGGAG